MRRASFAVLTLLLAPASATLGQQYQGASVALEALAGVVGDRNIDNAALLRLATDLVAFKERNGTLPTKEAAKQWMILADRWFKFQALRKGALSYRDVISALPPPSAWPDLCLMIDAEVQGTDKLTSRNRALKLTGVVLKNDPEGLVSTLKGMKSPVNPMDAAEESHEDDELDSQIELSSSAIGDLGPIQAKIQKEFKKREAFADRGYEAQVEDWVALFGPDRAEAMLRNLLTSISISLSFSENSGTAELASRVALDLSAKLKAPQWDLVRHSPDRRKLFEALEAKFVPAKEAASNPKLTAPLEYDLLYKRAIDEYLDSLLADGEIDRATALAKRIPLSYLAENTIYRAKATQFISHNHIMAWRGMLEALLKQDSNASLWIPYALISEKAGRLSETLPRLQTAVSQQRIPPKIRKDLKLLIPRLLLADDRVEEGVAAILALDLESQGVGGDQSIGFTDSLAMTLLRSGIALKRDDWVWSGWKALSSYDADGKWGEDPLWLMARAGHLEIVEEKIIEGIRSEGNDSDRFSALQKLATIYHLSGRYGDVLELFQKGKDWGFSDLAKIADYYWRYDDLPMGYVAATALAKTGRKEEALKIAETMLDRGNQCEGVYALYLELQSPDAVLLKLDRLIAADRFEERPLIWKAKALLKSKRLNEAEKATKSAIATDPHESDELFNRRSLAYSTLADIREAQGDAVQAASFRKIADAFHLAAEADQLEDAGSIGRAVAAYEKALTLYPEAYSIETQLANKLIDIGRIEAGIEHLKKAFESLPAKIGRIESFYLGISVRFPRTQAQVMTEQTFLNLLASHPNSPQLHYLVGSFYQWRQNLRKALIHYQKAAELDPDYLEAWISLNALDTQKVAVPAALSDRTYLNLLRLHGSFTTSPTDTKSVVIYDASKLWDFTINYSRPVSNADQRNMMPLPMSQEAPEIKMRGKHDPPDNGPILDAATIAELEALRKKLDGPRQMLARATMIHFAVEIANDTVGQNAD